MFKIGRHKEYRKLYFCFISIVRFFSLECRLDKTIFSHRKTHDPKDNFKCEVCGKTFARNENLQKHIQSNCDGLTSGLANANLTVLDLSNLIKTDTEPAETVVEEVDVSYYE